MLELFVDLFLWEKQVGNICSTGVFTRGLESVSKQQLTASFHIFSYVYFLRMQPSSERCLRLCATRHPFSNRHYGFRLHVPPQHFSHLPLDEGLESAAMGESNAHLRGVSFECFCFRSIRQLKFTFYEFKSFAWIVATLFGITGYATFTTLSQGNLISIIAF